ncbi:MAG: Hfq-like protein [Terriglobales bacterium]
MRKDDLDPGTAPRTPEADNFGNRRLIRPSLPRPVESARLRTVPLPQEREEQSDRPRPHDRKLAPPEQTHAENFYYQKQMQSRTPLVIVLSDGEEVRGVLEWYDKRCIKVNRTDGHPNLLIYKPSIKYIFKEAENNQESADR